MGLEHRREVTIGPDRLLYRIGALALASVRKQNAFDGRADGSRDHRQVNLIAPELAITVRAPDLVQPVPDPEAKSILLVVHLLRLEPADGSGESSPWNSEMARS